MAFGCGFGTLVLGGVDRKLLPLSLMSQGSAILLWLFLTIHSLLNGVTETYGLTAFLTVSLCCAGACLGFSNVRFHNAFFSSLRVYLAFCGLSFLLTVILALGVGLHTLYIATISVKHYEGVGDVYFPFTIAYGYREFFGLVLPRCGAGFRESGISQAFFAFAILTIPELRRRRHWLMLLLLVIGGIGAQSTTGMALVGLSLGLRVLSIEGIGFRMRFLLLCLVAVLAVISVDTALNDQTVGLAAKVDTQSYYDRKFQTINGFDYFMEHPLGAGVYSTQAPEGINLIASLGNIGIFGLLAVVMNLWMSLLGSANRLKKAMVLLPLFLTGLTSQPLLDAPFVYLCYGFMAFSPALSRARAPGAISRARNGKTIFRRPFPA